MLTYLTMVDVKRPPISVILAAVEIGMRLSKSAEDAEKMAQSIFNHLRTEEYYPTVEAIVKECGIVVDERENKPWPPEDDCRGCDRHKAGPHRFGCTIRLTPHR